MTTQVRLTDILISADTERELNEAMTDLYRAVSHEWTKARNQTTMPGVLPQEPTVKGQYPEQQQEKQKI